MPDIPEDFALATYDYDLPEAQIAQFPCKQRGSSRLMVLGNPEPEHASFQDLARLLPPGSLLIANNSRVVHARLVGARPGGGRAEFLLLTPLPLINNQDCLVEGLLRPAARIPHGAGLRFGDIAIEVLEKSEFGKCRARISWQGDLETALARNGRLPLPPYIKRLPEQSDESRYQTVYASKSGSVAAPTAGLHFTEAIKSSLLAAGHEWREISLHTGYGTFSPVRTADIRQHEMHREYFEVSHETAGAVREAMASGRPLIAVGTTSARALEGLFALKGEICPFSGFTDIFLYPGKKFNVISGLITNFHLPKSSLLLLVSAFAGRKRILQAYAEAVQKGYLFFSYGDAMLIK